jgi:drug/metabolite transporter (DMT)-like permease
MKSIIYALIGIILYAVQNTIIDVRLKQYSTVSLLVGMYIILLPLGVGLFLYQKYMGQAMITPSGNDFKIVAFVAAMFFIGDFFYVGAYTSGGNVVTITILLVLMPVIGGLMKFWWLKESPTPYHFVAFVCAALAIVFIALGDSKKPTELKTTRLVESVSFR